MGFCRIENCPGAQACKAAVKGRHAHKRFLSVGLLVTASARSSRYQSGLGVGRVSSNQSPELVG